MDDMRELGALYPDIPWGTPVPVTVAGVEGQWWACRVCIAAHGLAAADLVAGRPPAFVYRSREEAASHILSGHIERGG